MAFFKSASDKMNLEGFLLKTHVVSEKFNNNLQFRNTKEKRGKTTTKLMKNIVHKKTKKEGER